MEEGISNTTKELRQQTVSQIGVAIASKFIPIASIFLFSRMMSVKDYGILNLFQSYLWIFTLLLSFNLHVAVGRYIYLIDAEIESFLGTTLLSVGFVFLCGSTGLFMFYDTTSELIGLSPFLLPLMLVIVSGQISESLITQITIYYRRGNLLFWIVASKALISLCFSIVLLFGWKNGQFFAVLLAESLASLILTTIVFILLRNTIKWKFKRSHLEYMASYALPLIPYMLGLTILSQFDRVLIDRFYGKDATGLYSLSYNLGVLLLPFMTAVLNAFTPQFFEALNRKNFAQSNQDARSIFALALVGTITIILFGPQFAVLILPQRYTEGFNIIPVVALGVLCSVGFQIWVRVLAYHHKTVLISIITIFCALFNIGLNFWLLPLLGWKIAAWTSVLAYFCMCVICIVVIKIGKYSSNLHQTWEGVWFITCLVIIFVNSQHQMPKVLRIGILLSIIWCQRNNLRIFLPTSEKKFF